MEFEKLVRDKQTRSGGNTLNQYNQPAFYDPITKNNKPINQPINETTSQPINQPTNQPIKINIQPSNQPIS